MVKEAGLELVFERNSFYRRQYLLALGAFGLSLFIIGFLIWILLYIIRNPTHPIYFATDNVGRLIEVVPVNQPNMTQDQLFEWAINAVQSAFSFDYVNYRQQLQNAQKYFTDYGWTNYMNALKLTNNLTAVINGQEVSVGKVTATPKILTEGILAGAYAYRLQMPLVVTYSPPPYDNGAGTFSNSYIVTVILQRQPILKSYKGLGVVQLIAERTTQININTNMMPTS